MANVTHRILQIAAPSRPEYILKPLDLEALLAMQKMLAPLIAVMHILLSMPYSQYLLAGSTPPKILPVDFMVYAKSDCVFNDCYTRGDIYGSIVLLGFGQNGIAKQMLCCRNHASLGASNDTIEFQWLLDFHKRYAHYY